MPLPADFEAKLWAAADQLWTNSSLKPSEYSTPILALIFLRYADARFGQAEKELAGKARRRGSIGKDDYHALGVLFVPETARFQRLLELPEGADIGKRLNDAMKAIEAENDELKDVLPKTYGRFDATMLKELLKLFGTIPRDVEGDVFGRIYEYFLGNFAPATLQKGGEFYTPISVVRLIVEVLEPYHGRILDPACGSGGMFVQSANFVAAHEKRAPDEISVYGIEKIAETLRLARMNLAVHGLSGDVKEANTYYDADAHGADWGKFDFVAANPPFNQNAVDKERIKDDRKRFPFGMPSVDNANYLWIQLFYSALGDKGRAGFVMANSASDARGSELELRKKLILTGAVDMIVMREHKISREMVYLLGRSPEFREHAIKSMSGATGRQRVQERCFDTFKMPIPPSELVRRFTDVVRPMFRSIQLLATKNRSLRVARDLLLPRLISGEIELPA
jgi:type I restriction enzyme M protein